MKMHFKENRLLFEETPEKPEPASEPAADKPAEAVAATTNVEQAKADVQAKFDELRAKILAVKHGERNKDQSIEEECEILIAKIAQMEDEFKVVLETKKLPEGIKDADAYETKLKEQLAQFDKEISALIERKNAADEVAIGLTATTEKQKALSERAFKIIDEATKEDLEFSLEDLQNVLGYYDLGKYENSEEKEKNKAVMEALNKNAEALKEAGILIGYMGGTDGTNHGLFKSEKFHNHKAQALKQLLAFHDADKLNVAVGSIDLAKDSPTRKLIEEYISKDSKDRYAFAKANKAEFNPGGKIFDAALAVERAEDRKQLLTGEKEASFQLDDNGGLATDEPGLVIELGDTKDTKEQRKSGIVLYEGKEKVVDKGEFDYEVGKDGTELIIKPLEKKEDSDELPPPFSYQLIPSVKEGAVFDLKVDEKTKVPSVSVVIGDDAIIGLELDRKTGEPTKEIPGGSGYTLKITPHKDNEPGKIEIRQLEKPGTPPDTTGQLKDAEHPNDTPEEKAARAYYKEQKIPYMTQAEALQKGTIEKKDNGLHVKEGYDWVVKNDDVKDKHQNHQNYATKNKEAPAAVPAPDAPTPEKLNEDPVTTFEIKHIDDNPENAEFVKICEEQIKALRALIKSGITIVDFSGTNCGPCQGLKPHFHAIAKEGIKHDGKDVKFANLNLENFYDGGFLEKEFGVEAFPTVIVFKDGKEIGKYVGGADKAELESEIQKILKTNATPAVPAPSPAPEAPKPAPVAPAPTPAENPAEKITTENVKLLATLKARFDSNKLLHPGVEWAKVKSALEKSPKALDSINKMEKAGHSPDVYFADTTSFDIGTCSIESPDSGKNLDYDQAVATAKAMGVELMTPDQYRKLQEKGKFDLTNWSWLKTNEDTKKTSNALYGFRNGDNVRVYQRNATSRSGYGSWRGSLRVEWNP